MSTPVDTGDSLATALSPASWDSIGCGLSGSSEFATRVCGQSATGTGMLGTSSSGIGVYGRVPRGAARTRSRSMLSTLQIIGPSSNRQSTHAPLGISHGPADEPARAGLASEAGLRERDICALGIL